MHPLGDHAPHPEDRATLFERSRCPLQSGERANVILGHPPLRTAGTDAPKVQTQLLSQASRRGRRQGLRIEIGVLGTDLGTGPPVPASRSVARGPVLKEPRPRQPIPNLPHCAGWRP